MALDPQARTAKLQGGEEVGFDKALLATGANVNILRLEGAELEGIHYLRAFGNSDAIREQARGGRAGGDHRRQLHRLRGGRLAAGPGDRGEHADARGGDALAHASATRSGAGSKHVLTDHGIEIFGGEELEAFEGDGDVSAVVTKGGRTVEGDMVVVGAGVRPDMILAERAGLAVDNGITCDARLETLGAGDLRRRRRLLLRQRDPRPAAAGRALGRRPAAGPPRREGDARLRRTPYREVPYFFSDLADWASLEYVGPAEEWDEVVIRGDFDGGEFSAWYLKDGGGPGRALGRSAPRTSSTRAR